MVLPSRDEIDDFISDDIIIRKVFSRYFVEFLHEMRPGYNPPTRETWVIKSDRMNNSNFNEMSIWTTGDRTFLCLTKGKLIHKDDLYKLNQSLAEASQRTWQRSR